MQRRRHCGRIVGHGQPRLVIRFRGGAEAETAVTEPPEASRAERVSPLAEGKEGDTGKPKLPLTWENVQTVLDEVRPYLQGDGGDCKIVDIDGSVVKLELEGACSSCSSSAVTLKMGIERTLMERIPEVTEVISVMPEEEPLSKEGVEEVLDGIRPFLSVSGGTIEMYNTSILEGDEPKIVLQMTGPPLKSMAVRVEIVNRIKRRFPTVQNIEIVGEDGESSA